MKRVFVLASASCALAFTFVLGANPVLAKQKAAPKSSSVTTFDVRACIGAEGSGPDEQIVACTKLINSGKIHKGHESDFYATRGAAYYASRQYDAAMTDYNKALSLEPKPEFYFQRALVLLAQTDEEKAKADLAQVMKLKPEFAPAYFIRGLIGYHAGDYKDALANFDAAAQRNPQYYQAIFARGAAKTRLGDESGGKDDVKQARGLSAHVDTELQGLGVVP